MSDTERPDPAQAPAPAEDEDLAELDYVDPLKRDPGEDALPGLDPIVPPIPPES
jgi:hypothetical protein